MVTRFMKNRKKRGHVSAGHGRIGKLWLLVPQEVKDKVVASKGSAPLIDVTQYGYSKVLGKGFLPENQAVVVKAKLVSKNAEKKIKECGGAVVLTA